MGKYEVKWLKCKPNHLSLILPEQEKIAEFLGELMRRLGW
jgi:hypothetical protein